MKTNRGLSTIRLVIIVIAVWAIAGISYYVINRSILPSSFTMRITKDTTSSGGNRVENDTLTFNNGYLVSGELKYDGSNIWSAETHIICIFNNGQWINSQTSDKETCKNQFYDFLPIITKGGLENAIKTDQLKPLNKCERADRCYELVK